MAEWTVCGFKVTMYQADHPPLHCHVRKDGDFIGKFNLETRRWMTGPRRHAAQANAAIAKWRRENDIQLTALQARRHFERRRRGFLRNGQRQNLRNAALRSGKG